jgi:serine/threonine protein kinase
LDENKITHRDLKPENFLLTETLQVKLADFGLAKRDMTQSTLCGSPLYLAPEILSRKSSSKTYDSRIDLYSAGVILYVMLTGKIPFPISDQTSEAELYDFILNGRVDWSDDRWSSNSNSSKNLCIRMMKTDPNERILLDLLEAHDWVLGIDDENEQSEQSWGYLKFFFGCGKSTRNLNKARISIGSSIENSIIFKDNDFLTPFHLIIYREEDGSTYYKNLTTNRYLPQSEESALTMQID